MLQKQLIKERFGKVDPSTSIIVVCKSHFECIKISEITHISRREGYTIVYTGAGVYKTNHPLQQILRQLPQRDFFRVHRLHVIAIKSMTGLDRNIIKGGDFFLPVTRYYKLKLQVRFRDILDDCCRFSLLWNKPL